VEIGFPGVSYSDPDRYAAEVLGTILGDSTYVCPIVASCWNVWPVPGSPPMPGPTAAPSAAGAFTFASSTLYLPQIECFSFRFQLIFTSN